MNGDTQPAVSGRIDHSPRTMGRIIDRAFELYRANFKTIALASLIVLFPFAMLVGVTQVFSTRGFLQFVGQMADFASEEVFFEEYSRLQAMSALSNVVTPLFFIAQAYVTSSLLACAPAMLAGESPGVRQFLSAGKSRFLWLLVVQVLVSFSVGAAAVALILPGVWLWVRLRVAHVTAVVEQAPLDRAFSRSWSLTAGRFWRTLGFAVVVSVIVFVLEAAIDSPAVIRQILASVNDPEAIFRELSAGWTTFEGVLAATATSLLLPFTELCWFFYYLDLRARGEGLDLVVAAGEHARRAVR